MMNQEIFYNYVAGALDNIRYNITTLTERYVNSGDDSESYTNAVEPLLEQQYKILELMKSIIK